MIHNIHVIYYITEGTKLIYKCIQFDELFQQILPVDIYYMSIGFQLLHDFHRFSTANTLS